LENIAQLRDPWHHILHRTLHNHTRFSASTLASAIRVLEPQPRDLLIGGGYTHEEVEEARKVWTEYVKEVLSEVQVQETGSELKEKVSE